MAGSDANQPWLPQANDEVSVPWDPPNPNRVALSYRVTAFCICYTYADELPCIIALHMCFAVVLFVLGTPLSLLCMVPSLKKLKQVRRCVCIILQSLYTQVGRCMCIHTLDL